MDSSAEIEHDASGITLIMIEFRIVLMEYVAAIMGLFRHEGRLLAHSTLTGANFAVWKGNVPVEGRVELTGSHSATFKPREKLEKGTTYTATIAAGIKDSSGGTMDERYEWSFTTVP